MVCARAGRQGASNTTGRFEPKARILERLVLLSQKLRTLDSGRPDGEARRPDVLTPADWAGRGPVETVPLSEDEAAAETSGRFNVQPLRRRPDRAGDVREVVGDLLLWNPDEARELVGGARALAELAEERFTDGD